MFYIKSSDQSGGSGFAAEKQLVPEVPPLFYKNGSPKDASAGAMAFAGTWRRKTSVKGMAGQASGAQKTSTIASIGAIGTIGRKKVTMPKKPPRKSTPDNPAENPDFRF